jgi:hypothetical protein
LRGEESILVEELVLLWEDEGVFIMFDRGERGG